MKGTIIKSKNGDIPIEEIKEGDEVWAYDEKTKEKKLKKVVQLFRNLKSRTTTLKIGENEPIVCTPEHPFYVLNTKEDTPIVHFEGRDNSQCQGQWVNAGHLKEGMKVLLAYGKNDIIGSVENEDLDEPMATYNFEVEDLHNYYVGTEGILVHNSCGLEDASFAQKTYSETFSNYGRGVYSEMAGRPINTIDDLAGAITDGTLSPSQIKLDYVVREGNKLILNTRKSQSLIRTGVPRSAWVGVNRTGQFLYEGLLTGQLTRNGLTSAGWMFPTSG